MKKIFSVLLLFPVLLLSSCTARVSGSLHSDGRADLNIYASLEPRMTALIRNFAAVGGAPAGAPILDGAALSASMSAAPGIASVLLRNRTPSSIEGTIAIARIADFLRHGEAAGFIGFEQRAAGGGRLTVTVDLDSGPDILALISPEISDYLGVLMAPLSTGEAMTAAEYLSLVTMVYGGGIAEEISRAVISVSVDLPGPVRSVTGGTFSGRRASFEVPLLGILVLETPLSYEIIW